MIITGNLSLNVRPAPQRSAFNPAPVSVEFVVYKVALVQVFLPALRLSPVTAIRPMHHSLFVLELLLSEGHAG